MKWFWLLILALVIATGVMFWPRSSEPIVLDKQSNPLPDSELTQVQPEVPETPPETAADPAPVTPSDSSELPDQVSSNTSPTPSDDPGVEISPSAEDSAAVESIATTEDPVPSQHASGTPHTPTYANPLNDPFAKLRARVENAMAEDTASIGESEGQGILGGEGTEDDPYRISWDLLLSASESYRPRENKRDIPEPVQALNGKHVEITGNILLPLGMGGETKELLLTLYMWDGCCIGVPPSPYDAVEVTLAQPLRMDRGKSPPYGTIRGKMLVDPYLVNDWLVGLYILEEAVIDLGL